MQPVQLVSAAHQARHLLHDLRRRVLDLAATPRSATEIAAQLGEPRQKINYHVRELAQAGLLRHAEERRRGNLIEQRYQRTARTYALSADLLEQLASTPDAVEDRASAGYLLALAGRTQAEVGRWMEMAAREEKRLATLSLDLEVRFSSPTQRAAFASDLASTLADLVERHSTPPAEAEEERPYRVVVGCYPRPRDTSADEESHP